jgi:hypothetical protein
MAEKAKKLKQERIALLKKLEMREEQERQNHITQQARKQSSKASSSKTSSNTYYGAVTARNTKHYEAEIAKAKEETKQYKALAEAKYEASIEIPNVFKFSVKKG